jgi:ABC-type nitrate/sulfonate/bicarbonate transport system permease component
MPLIEANGCDFYYEQHGQGRDMVFIHSEIHGLEYWEHQANIKLVASTGYSPGQRCNVIMVRTDAPTSPYIFTGMRISLAVALIVMVISEMVAASNGIGYFILSAQRGFKIRDMFAGVLTLAVLGYVLNRLFLMIENHVLAWHYGYTQQRS